jgi:hypothetical protein
MIESSTNDLSNNKARLVAMATETASCASLLKIQFVEERNKRNLLRFVLENAFEFRKGFVNCKKTEVKK